MAMDKLSVKEYEDPFKQPKAPLGAAKEARSMRLERKRKTASLGAGQ